MNGETPKNAVDSSDLPENAVNVGRRKGEDQVLLALLAGATVSAAARAAGLADTTVRRWLARAAFRKRLGALRDGAVAGGLGLLLGHVEKAVGTVAALLDAENESVRLQAARLIIESVVRLRGEVDTSERLSQIEEQVSGLGGHSLCELEATEHKEPEDEDDEPQD